MALSLEKLGKMKAHQRTRALVVSVPRILTVSFCGYYFYCLLLFFGLVLVLLILFHFSFLMCL